MSGDTPKQAARQLAAKQIVRGFEPTALHVYYDSAGQELYWRIRLKHPNTGEKWIRPMHRTKEGTFRLGEPTFDGKKPLYHLFAVTQHPDEVVWITEGEWCADHLSKLGLTTSTSGGADSVAATDWSPLAHRNIIIWPDNDVAGLRYALDVTRQLQQINCNVKWIDTAKLNLMHKGDCVDWLVHNPAATKIEIESLSLIQSRVHHQEPPQLLVSTNKQNANYSFVTDNQGVWFSDEAEKWWICSKLEVKALVRDKASENWGRLLEFHDADGNSHQWAMPMEMLKGSCDELRGELMRLGLEIAPRTKARHLLVEYIITTKPEARARCVTRTGWHNTLFVLPQVTIGSTTEQVLYQSENQTRDYQQSGTLKEWQEHIAALCVGNSRLVLAVSIAFAAMLVYPANMESGGIHLVGSSSCGKTTALRVAASVYGAPNYLHRWRATTNGLEALAALRCDTLLILDELAQVDAKEAGEIAYLLANGSGKARAARNGSARSRYEWRLLFLSAGEISLSQHMHEVGKKTRVGQEVRLVDIPADAGVGLGLFETLYSFESGAMLSKNLMEATEHYYGTPALAFLEQITDPKNLNSLSLFIKQFRSKFIRENIPNEAGGQVHRVCERFALIALGGELATHYGLTGWQMGQAIQAANTCFRAWLEQRGTLGNQERSIILEQVQAFFEAHGASRFEDMQQVNSQRIAHRIGFKRINRNNEYEYLVLPEMFRREICAGLDPKFVAQVLVEAGMLNPSSEGKALTPHRLPGEGVKKCYHFIKTEPK